MTRKNKASKTKVLFTILQIFVFVGVMLYADVFGNSSEEPISVNEAFLGEEDYRVWINPDNVSIDTSDNQDSIIYYIVQNWDNLEKISKEFWIPVAELEKINRLGDTPIKEGQRLIVSDQEEGIPYVVKTARTLKLFAEYYRLNLDDLITLNHFSDESEMLYPGQEIFINVTEQRAYDIGLLEKPQPILPKDEVIQPKKKKVVTPTQSVKVSGGQQKDPVVVVPTNSKTKSQWVFNENGQRLFGGNAKDWYANAQSERAKAAGIKVSRTMPKVGAIVVYQQLRSYAGHVAVVKSYDPSTGEMVVEDMNYVGKYIVTQRSDSTSNPKIVWYVYH